MTAKQSRDAIARIGLSQEKAGAFFGVSARSSRRWISGEYPVPPAVDYCLKLMIEHGVEPGALDKRFA